MGFMFKNIDSGKIYSINEIDEIAAKFWGKEVEKRTYATPDNCPFNWFDMLGHPIEDLQYFISHDAENRIIYKRSNKQRDAEFDMQEVASLMLNDVTRYCDSAEDMLKMANFIKPYLELCFHLKSLNIVGVGRGW